MKFRNADIATDAFVTFTTHLIMSYLNVRLLVNILFSLFLEVSHDASHSATMINGRALLSNSV